MKAVASSAVPGYEDRSPAWAAERAAQHVGTQKNWRLEILHVKSQSIL
jgi:hypothetical protein